MKRTLVTLFAAVLLTSGFAFAQQRPVSGLPAGRMVNIRAEQPKTINQRRENQQDRIAQGVRSGQLTPRETARLENREARINHQIRHDRSMNDGRLTKGERTQINREQNRESRAIYRDKHNGYRQ
jgi:hypothetical protein